MTLITSYFGGESDAVPEQRHALRAVPRRTLTIKLTAGRDGDALMLSDWVEANAGKPALYPLPHLCRRTAGAAKGDTVLPVSGAHGRFERALQPLRPGVLASGSNPSVSFPAGGPMVIRSAAGGAILIVDAEHGHQIYGAQVTAPDTLTLDESLARPVSAAARVYPLVAGVMRQAARFDHLAGQVVDTVLDIDVAPPEFDRWAEGGWTPAETWAGLPVFTSRLFGATWEDQEFGFSPTIEVLDNEAAPVWFARASTNPHKTLKRRILVGDESAIENVLGLLDYLRGRQQPLWVDDALDGLEFLSSWSFTNAGVGVKINRKTMPTVLRKPTVLRIDGARPLGTAGLHSYDGGAFLMLAEYPATVSGSPPEFTILPGMTATRMAKCRLDHDAVELIWHTDGVLEVNLVFHEIPVTYRAMVGGYNF